MFELDEFGGALYAPDLSCVHRTSAPDEAQCPFSVVKQVVVEWCLVCTGHGAPDRLTKEGT
jgi:hypothetical protein